jgi:TonB family protein
MDSKSIFIWPVLISIVGHVALITASSMIDLRDNAKTVQLFTVQIAQSEPVSKPKQEEKPAPEETPKPTQEVKPIPQGTREETVHIGSSDVKYAAYLAELKRKIMSLWQYPAGAFENSEEGEVVIKISIDSDGNLAHTMVITSSGSVHLDSGTLGVIQAAAPFQPLPSQYDLSRLHIIASFNYRLHD